MNNRIYNNEDKSIEILKAYKAGKLIEYYVEAEQRWYPVLKDNILMLLLKLAYHTCRIKPEPKYRPYEHNEFIEAEKVHRPRIRTNHGSKMIYNVFDEGFLWNKDELPKNGGDPIVHDFSELLKFKWEDGTPCGIIE